ncbi:MAG: hypothetical protein ABI639_11665 [Thermoanaerobaculia bacterium]
MKKPFQLPVDILRNTGISGHPPTKPLAVKFGLLIGLVFSSWAIAQAALSGEEAPLPDRLANDGKLYFASAVDLRKAWELDSLRTLSNSYPASDSLADWAEKLREENGSRKDGPCSDGGPIVVTDNPNLSSDDIRVRSIHSDISVVGVVTALSTGWSAAYSSVSTLVRFRIEKVFHDRGKAIEVATDLLTVFPGGSLDLAGQRVCVEARAWPALAKGDRILLNGFWLSPSSALVNPLEISKIVDGQLLAGLNGSWTARSDSQISEADFAAWWSSRRQAN